jgi:hypothetical protein
VTTKFDYCLVELSKIAAEQPAEKKKNPHLEAAKVIGGGILGFGAGQLAGVGIGKGLEYLTKRKGGNPADMARKVAPIAGAAAGILYPLWQSNQRKAADDAFESADNDPPQRVPG